MTSMLKCALLLCLSTVAAMQVGWYALSYKLESADLVNSNSNCDALYISATHSTVTVQKVEYAHVMPVQFARDDMTGHVFLEMAESPLSGTTVDFGDNIVDAYSHFRLPEVAIYRKSDNQTNVPPTETAVTPLKTRWACCT